MVSPNRSVNGYIYLLSTPHPHIIMHEDTCCTSTVNQFPCRCTFFRRTAVASLPMGIIKVLSGLDPQSADVHKPKT